MTANYIVLINGRLADTHNYPQYSPIVEEQAAFFWRMSATNYAWNLIRNLPLYFHVEVRSI